MSASPETSSQQDFVSRGLEAAVRIGLVFLLLAAGVWTGLLGQDWSTADGGRWEPAGREHWFGTNLLGQDIFQRAVYSVRTAFEIGLVVAVLSTLLGAVLGTWIFCRRTGRSFLDVADALARVGL